jgi:aerobic carbon-monoxide dehydrogenase medium subunit
MIPSTFDYVRPNSVDEAISALKAGGEDSKVITGGQSMLPLLRLRLAAPSVLVDCGRIDEMKGIKDNGDSVTIGAATTHWDVLHSDIVNKHVKLLAQATETVADPQIRHRGTFGGALAHGDPAGDLPAVVLALDATLEIAGSKGRRQVAAKDFFLDYFTTAVGPDEILVSITIPKLGKGWGTCYEKFNRSANGWAVVGVAAAVKVDGGKITEARIALTNCAAVPVRASIVESALKGVAAKVSEIEAASQSAAEGTRATSDLAADKEYREHLMRVITARAVSCAAGV